MNGLSCKFQFVLLSLICIYLSMCISWILNLHVTVDVGYFDSDIWSSDLPHLFLCSLRYYASGEIWWLWLHLYSTQVGLSPPPHSLLYTNTQRPEGKYRTPIALAVLGLSERCPDCIGVWRLINLDIPLDVPFYFCVWNWNKFYSQDTVPPELI